MRCFLVFALGTMLVLGSFVNLNAEQTYKLKKNENDQDGPIKQIKDKTKGKIQSTNNTFKIVLRSLEGMAESDINDDYVGSVKGAFASTYLREEDPPSTVAPKLTEENGTVIASGWEDILHQLWKYQHPSPKVTHRIDVNDTEVLLDYQAYDLVQAPDVNNDTDLLMEIKTQLEVGSPAVLLIGTSEHRRSCDPYP